MKTISLACQKEVKGYINKFCFVMFLSFFSVFNGYAQVKKSDFSIGDKVSFYSKVLNERRLVVVIPPFNINDHPNEKFPVLFVLDPGNNLFATFGIVNYYSDMLKIIPKMIIVGIVSNDRERDYLPSPSVEHPTGGGADRFLNFIKSELVPVIDSAYPAKKERVLIGHSAGGLFAIYALEHQPDLFDALICIDPSLWYDSLNCVRKIPDYFMNSKFTRKSVFVSLSNEKEMGVFPLIEAFEKYSTKDFRWDFVYYKDETHNSLGFKSICSGLEMIYKDWKPTEVQR